MKTLYTRDASGTTRFWRMELNPDNPTQYRTVSGVLGGTEVPTAWTMATPKNVRRSNATTAEEQAVAEMEAAYRQKLDRKYHEDPDNVGGHKFFAPMLAQTLDSYVKQVLGHTAFVQPKLDGYRCVASRRARATGPGTLRPPWSGCQTGASSPPACAAVRTSCGNSYGTGVSTARLLSAIRTSRLTGSCASQSLLTGTSGRGVTDA